MSTTKETKVLYIQRALSKMQQANQEAFELNSDLFIEDYIEKYQGKEYKCTTILNTCLWAKKYWNKKLHKNTWRLVRASLKFYSKVKLKQELITIKEYKKINSILMEITGAEKNEIPKRTSSTKAKKINEKDYEIIQNALFSNRSKWAKKTILWLEASILSGLRPVEWQTAKIEDNVLVVKNAKATNGRASGEYRTINLKNLEKREIDIIKKQIEVAQKEKDWKKYYNGCSRLIKNVSRKELSKRERYPTLYTGRHQFSANLKANGSTKAEVAALMGHISDETAQRHYGKKTYGTKTRTPEANPAEVQKIKSKDKLFTFDNKNKRKK